MKIKHGTIGYSKKSFTLFVLQIVWDPVKDPGALHDRGERVEDEEGQKGKRKIQKIISLVVIVDVNLFPAIFVVSKFSFFDVSKKFSVSTPKNLH